MSDLDLEFGVPTITDDGEEDLHSDRSLDLSLLRLDSFNSSRTSNHCASCGFSGSSPSNNKRRSPDLPAPTMENGGKFPKKPKKLFHDPQDATADTDHASFHRGFSKISLPINIQEPQRQTTSRPVFRRCLSDPTRPPLANPLPQSPPESINTMGINMVTTPIGGASLPPRAPYRRTISDPSPSKGFSRSSSSNDLDESRNQQVLKKMGDCMRELNDWWKVMLPEEHMCEEEQMCEEEDAKEDEENITTEVQADHGTDREEVISVEKAGECLIIHFNCPCGKNYQILLSGNNCYYKLM